MGSQITELNPMDIQTTELCNSEKLVFPSKKKKAKHIDLQVFSDFTVNNDNEYDYSYEFLCKNIYKHITDNASKQIKRLYIHPMDVIISTKYTIIQNFVDICIQLNHEPNNICYYYSQELVGTTCIVLNCSLKIKGKYKLNELQRILKNYIKEYIYCNDCKNYDSIIYKENQLTFKSCNYCKSRKSITLK